MTVEQDQKQERLEEEDQPAVWVGEPLRLNRDGIGDLYWQNLVTAVSLPAKHVHPAIRESAEMVLGAQAELDQLRRKLAARPGEREQLMRTARSAPDRADQLQRFDSETEYVSSFDLPESEQGVYTAWESFAAAVAVSGGEWDSYLLQVGSERAQAAAVKVDAAVETLQELAMIDSLLAREGIYHPRTDTPAEISARQDRWYRNQSLATITAGQDLGAEGPRFGLVELLLQYRSAFTKGDER